MKNGKVSLTLLLSGLITISMLLNLTIQLVSSYRNDKTTLTETTLSRNFATADKIGHTVASLFGSMRLSLRETGDYFVSRAQAPDEELQEHLELIRSTSHFFNSIMWIDAEGIIRNIAPVSVGLKGTRIAAGGVAQEALKLKRPNISVPYVGSTGRLLMLVSEPLFDADGSYLGMIAGTIYLQEKNVLGEILGNNVVDPSGSYYYVVDSKGTLLFHPDPRRIGDNVAANPAVQRIMHGETGTRQVTNTQGTPMLASYTSVPDLNWGVVQQTPVSHINEQIGSHLISLLLYMLTPYLALLILSLLIARRLAGPFVLLANLAKEIATGKEVTIPQVKSHWNREVDDLTKTAIIAMEAMQERNQALALEAKTDPLTGLSNRRVLERVMETLCQSGTGCSLIMLDIDHFKSVNDTFGHQMGDKVLQLLAQVIRDSIRVQDSAYRFGGEEFVVLLPETAPAEAWRLAETIRTAVERSVTPIGREITVSLGIASFPTGAANAEQLVRQADEALYESKQNGRNRTTVAAAK